MTVSWFKFKLLCVPGEEVDLRVPDASGVGMNHDHIGCQVTGYFLLLTS